MEMRGGRQKELQRERERERERESEQQNKGDIDLDRLMMGAGVYEERRVNEEFLA